MAKYTGVNMTADFASVTLVEIISLTINETSEVYESTAAADTAKEYLGGLEDATFSIECRMDDGDVVFDALAPGASGALNFYPEGNSSGKPKAAVATAFVTNRTLGTTYNSVTPVTATLQCSGGVTWSTVA